MRKLMWFSLGFGISCALCAYGLPKDGMLPLTVSAAVLSIFAFFIAVRYPRARISAVLCLGCAAGLSWFMLFQGLYLQNAKNLDETEQTVTIRASDYSYETAYGIAVDGVLEQAGKPYRARVYLDAQEKTVAPGDIVAGTFRFRMTVPEGGGSASYHRGEGIFLLCYPRGEVCITAETETPWWCRTAVLRKNAEDILQNAFPEDAFPLAKALLLGDTSDLSYAADTAFKVSGIRHIVAVSGLHVSVLYSLLSFLTAKKRWLTAIAALPTLFLFAAVVGFTPSVSRACIMTGLMLLANLAQREYDPPTELAFSCLVMLAVNPLAVTSVSFQLSAGCVAGIILFQAPIQAWLKAKIHGKGKMKSGFCTSVSMTLGAMSLTTPLTAWYFGTVSLVGILTNLLTLWAVTFLFGGILAVILLHLICAKFAALLGWILAWLCRYVVGTAKILASVPLAAVYTQSVYIVAWLAFVYILLGIFLISREKQPGILISCGCLGLCIALLASWTEPRMDNTRLTVLDVGQGQSILFQSEGKTYLIDCGGDSDTGAADLTAETLLSQGVFRLDGMVLTHGDRDHAGAAQNLLTRVDADIMFLPEGTEGIVTRGKTAFVKSNTVITYGNTKITIFAPTFYGESNENSLCVLFETENCAILITGDRSAFGERMLLRQAALPNVDVLIAGHHGSRNSTSWELLDAVNPKTVIISVGQGNPYGHPSQELLERLADFDCAVYRTDLQGTILLKK